MRKNELNNLLRDYVKNHLSPIQAERNFVSDLYAAFKTALNGNSILIGSYARFTAIRPLHDLDILFISGIFDPARLDPQQILDTLQNTVRAQFKNPTNYQYEISQQTHSVTVSFLESGKEKLAVDIVPAFTSGLKNEYGDDVYWVPEIIKYSPRTRKVKYEAIEKTKKSEIEWWLKSDPRGYIKAATDINGTNNDFRKTAKIAKRWKHNCKEKFGEFKLKSFHVEQEIYAIFRKNPDIGIADALFQFFCDLPKFISRPHIKDRADASKFIDDYIAQLTSADKETIIHAKDAFLIKLENMAQSSSVENLLEAEARRRVTSTEAYLFDSGIPTYTDPNLTLTIRARVLPRAGSFREYFLDAIGKIVVDRKIEFRRGTDSTNAHHYKWKVKNDDTSDEPRGEITDHQTKNDPENSKFRGNHFVECYAIKDGVCIARARQNVVLYA